MLWMFIVLSVIASSTCDDSEWRQVRTAQGDVRGRKDPDGGLYAFYNIPYATVPTGRDRFKAPLPGPVWLQPLDAVDRGIVCLQGPSPFIDVATKTVQEDCLVANIFVPDTEDKNLPVIVSVHGGGFEIGFGQMISPKYLVKNKKVIVVNFNYRLGVQGFLCLGTKDAPGNAGLKDQVALLRWVKRNIANFGGNPDDITISGGSAGSISVHLLILSKAAKGLFTKVIAESGADVASISVQIDPLENAKTFAKMLNFTDVDDFTALQEFYLNTPLKLMQVSTFVGRIDFSLLFAPCVERKTGEEIILEDSPVNLIKKGKYNKVPILIGVGEMEGLIQVPNFDSWKIGMNDKFSDFLPADLQFESREEKDEIGKRVKEFYFGHQPIGEESILAYIDYIGDMGFNYPTLRSVRLHVDGGHDQIYLYEYSYVDESTTPVIPHTNVRGAGHCSQSIAIYDGVTFVTSDESTLSDEYRQMKATLREMWYNFAVFGKPVPEGSSLPVWPAAGANGSPYMSLGKPVKLEGAFLEKRAQLWDDIYDKYYKGPSAPPQPPREKHLEL